MDVADHTSVVHVHVGCTVGQVGDLVVDDHSLGLVEDLHDILEVVLVVVHSCTGEHQEVVHNPGMFVFQSRDTCVE